MDVPKVRRLLSDIKGTLWMATVFKEESISITKDFDSFLNPRLTSSFTVFMKPHTMGLFYPIVQLYMYVDDSNAICHNCDHDY